MTPTEQTASRPLVEPKDLLGAKDLYKAPTFDELAPAPPNATINADEIMDFVDADLPESKPGEDLGTFTERVCKLSTEAAEPQICGAQELGAKQAENENVADRDGQANGGEIETKSGANAEDVSKHKDVTDSAYKQATSAAKQATRDENGDVPATGANIEVTLADVEATDIDMKAVDKDIPATDAEIQAVDKDIPDEPTDDGPADHAESSQSRCEIL